MDQQILRKIIFCLLMKSSKVPCMNNKFMYNRFIILEIGEQHEWKSTVNKESLQLNKLQREYARKKEKTKINLEFKKRWLN